MIVCKLIGEENNEIFSFEVTHFSERLSRDNFKSVTLSCVVPVKAESVDGVIDSFTPCFGKEIKEI